MLLEAAVAEFAAAGYEAATMSGIAKRAKSPIGSLYQFFPNKEAVARALRARQIADLECAWTALEPVAKPAAIEAFVTSYVATMVEFVRTHPAFVPLLDAPSSTVPLGDRNRLRRKLAAMLQRVRPGLATRAATRCAEVVFQVNKALMGLYAASPSADRRWLRAEYHELVLDYLARRLAAPRSPRRA